MTAWLATTKLALKQAVRSLNRRRLRHRRAARRATYAQWVQAYDTIDDQRRAAMARRAADLHRRGQAPLISVLMPTHNPSPVWFPQAVASVQRQIYPAWQLCIADDASSDAQSDALLSTAAATDARIQVQHRQSNGHIAAATNTALSAATGDWVVFLDHDDVMAEHALLFVAEAIAHHPQAELIYSDEDMLGPDGERETPYFKPDWNLNLCHSQNYVCHLLAVKRTLLANVGGLRESMVGAQDHDLVLRCAETLMPAQIVHIPHVLYHWRRHPDSTAGAPESKPYAVAAGQRAVQEHLQRVGESAAVHVLGAGRYHVQHALPDPAPSVCIVIPTRNQSHLLRTCIDSLLRLTDYPHFEVLVVDNGTTEPAALAYLATLDQRVAMQANTHATLRVLRDPLQPFNYSTLNNRAVAQTQATCLVLMNNDIEVLDSTWLREMVAHAMRPTVGAVGAKLLYPDGTVQHAGVVVGVGQTPPRVAGPTFKGLARHAGGHGGRAGLTQSYSAVTAACLAVQRSRFLAVGGFDDANLAVAFNDVDLCLKLRDAGWTNVWTPHAVLHHHESISRGRDNTAANGARFSREVAWMAKRWQHGLSNDPAYNPNLNWITADFELAQPPRVSLDTPWFQDPARQDPARPNASKVPSP
jgi:O-antigen biosynthesis protein